MSGGRPARRASGFGTSVAWWGVVGIVLLFASAIGRLWPPALALFGRALSPPQWAALTASLLLGGLKGGWLFRRRLAPRVAARAAVLREAPTPARALFAPLFCLGYFGAPKARRIAAYATLSMIVALILLVRHAPQPWRGIVDAGVLFGLAGGIVALIAEAVSVLSSLPSEERARPSLSGGRGCENGPR